MLEEIIEAQNHSYELSPKLRLSPHIVTKVRGLHILESCLLGTAVREGSVELNHAELTDAPLPAVPRLGEAYMEKNQTSGSGDVAGWERVLGRYGWKPAIKVGKSLHSLGIVTYSMLTVHLFTRLQEVSYIH